MDKLLVKGNKRINGRMRNQTSKNAVLAMLAASILTDKEVIIRQCPKITDVDNMAKILVELGCKVKWEGDSLVIDCSSAHRHEIPHSLAKELRSSIFMLGPILEGFTRLKWLTPAGAT